MISRRESVPEEQDCRKKLLHERGSGRRGTALDLIQYDKWRRLWRQIVSSSFSIVTFIIIYYDSLVFFLISFIRIWFFLTRTRTHLSCTSVKNLSNYKANVTSLLHSTASFIPKLSDFPRKFSEITRAAVIMGIAHLLASVREVAKFHDKMWSARLAASQRQPATAPATLVVVCLVALAATSARRSQEERYELHFTAGPKSLEWSKRAFGLARVVRLTARGG